MARMLIEALQFISAFITPNTWLALSTMNARDVPQGDSGSRDFWPLLC
jgi:hypothetical protein